MLASLLFNILTFLQNQILEILHRANIHDRLITLYYTHSCFRKRIRTKNIRAIIQLDSPAQVVDVVSEVIDRTGRERVGVVKRLVGQNPGSRGHDVLLSAVAGVDRETVVISAETKTQVNSSFLVPYIQG